ncbi:MAG TPA: acyltransferase domain-containing protein [Amycolatopsis sp.]|nr:acyltransferase domain-containing protein [Amycolatopsis sp.]
MTRSVVLLVPGQGAQHPRMAVDLYHGHDGFCVALDEVFALWGSEGQRIRADWLGEEPRTPLDDLRRSQPLLFAIGYALATALSGEGIEPVALAGHSVGEVVAAVIAGVFRLSDAAELLAERVAQLADAPAGGMAAVAASVAEVKPYLTGEVHVAAVNAARQIMLAGLTGPLAETTRRLREAGFTVRPVRTHNPFHSPILAPYADRALPALRRLRLSPPRLPVYSGYTGRLLTDAEATDPTFWAAQPARPVYFADAVTAAAGTGPHLFVESGPGQSLTAVARRNSAVRAAGSRALALLPARAGGDTTQFATTVADIFATAIPTSEALLT